MKVNEHLHAEVIVFFLKLLGSEVTVELTANRADSFKLKRVKFLFP